MDKIEELVRGDLVTAAVANTEALAKRLSDSEEAAKRAEADHRAAETALKAAYGASGGDPLKAEKQLAEAAFVLDVAKRVLAGARAAHQTSIVAQRTAQGEAWLPVYMEGIRRRISAAAKADQGRALLAAAEAEYSEGTGLLERAYHNGTEHRVPSEAWNRTIGTEQAERAIWGAAA